MSYTLIERKELTEAASTISFDNIPQTFTDLVVKISTRHSNSDGFAFPYVLFNGVSANQLSRNLSGSGTSASTEIQGSIILWTSNGSTSTANTFGNTEIYIPNYSGSSAKSVLIDSVAENNATAALQYIIAGLWNNTAPITSLGITNFSPHTHLAGSTFSLYGINRQQAIGKPKAIGGAITFANGYWVHTFNSSGTFATLEDLECQYLVIGGGGGGGQGDCGGGGGAGGYRSSAFTQLSGGGSTAEPVLKLSSFSSYSVVVGAGGAGAIGFTPGISGQASSFHSISSLGGGGGASQGVSNAGLVGGSGGGGVFLSGSGGAGTTGQGFAGGSHNGANVGTGGGGGGASQAGGIGGPRPAGNGGNGVASSITGSSVTRAGGGGGGNNTINQTQSVGGSGGGGAGGTDDAGEQAVAGTLNTGSGGGGSGSFGGGGNGGSGIVIIRYLAS